MHLPPRRVAFPLVLLSLSALPGGVAAAEIADAWARATVPGQSTAAAYMTVTSATPARIVGASSPAAAVVEVHEMSMDGTMMRMRPVAGLDLPAGKAVVLKPGGLHVMLMDLRQPLKAGDRLPVTLKVEGADRKVVEQRVDVEVRDVGAGAPSHGR